MTKRNPKFASRRTFLKLAGAGIAAPALLRATYTVAAEPITYVGWGGAAQEVAEKIFIKPFMAETGIQVQVVNGPDLAKAKGQVDSGQIEWDVMDLAGDVMAGGEKADLFAELPKGLFPSQDELTLPTRKSGVPYMQYAGVMAYSPSRAGDKYPRTFKDFFDGQALPGRRGMRTFVGEQLEMALLADGVAPASLYPLDVDRGFKSLDKVKPFVAKWIDQTQQTISLLQNNEIDFSYTYNGRVEKARQSGVDVDFSRDQALILTEYLAVLKGSPRIDNAMKFIAYYLNPERQAQFSEAYNAIPVVKAAFPLVKPEVIARLPDVKNPANVVLNDSWWLDRQIELDRRFKEWLAT